MTEDTPNFAEAVADKAFLITMVTAALFIGAAFIFVIL